MAIFWWGWKMKNKNKNLKAKHKTSWAEYTFEVILLKLSHNPKKWNLPDELAIFCFYAKLSIEKFRNLDYDIERKN